MRVVTFDSKKENFTGSAMNLRYAASYPADALVGDGHGQVQTGIAASNSTPWCIQRPADDAALDLIKGQWEAHAGSGSEPPYCPDAFLAQSDNLFTADDVERWATRGAMNAGMAVFLYLDALSKGQKQHAIPYDHCEQLPH